MSSMYPYSITLNISTVLKILCAPPVPTAAPLTPGKQWSSYCSPRFYHKWVLILSFGLKENPKGKHLLDYSIYKVGREVLSQNNSDGIFILNFQPPRVRKQMSVVKGTQFVVICGGIPSCPIGPIFFPLVVWNSCISCFVICLFLSSGCIITLTSFAQI